jgi:hypothetical protein
MARFTQRYPKNEELIQSRDKLHSFLQQQNIINAGVGVGLSKKSQAPCLVLHLQEPLSQDQAKIVQDYCSDVEIEVVGKATTY